MDKEMEVLLSEKEIKLGDRTVVVKRIALLDTIRLASHISEIVGSVMGNSALFDNAVGKILYSGRPVQDAEGKEIRYENEETVNDINGIKVLGIVEFIGLIGDDGVDLLKDLIVKSTNLNESEIEDIDCIEGIDLISEIYTVNKSFFEKCMSKLGDKMKKKSQKSVKTVK